MSLVDLGLLKKGNETGRHPVYRVNVASKKFAACPCLPMQSFFEMPGTKKDGKMVLPGTRVFTSFAAAQRLSEALTGILEKAHRDGGMEQYIASGTKQDISTKVR